MAATDIMAAPITRIFRLFIVLSFHRPVAHYLIYHFNGYPCHTGAKHHSSQHICSIVYEKVQSGYCNQYRCHISHDSPSAVPEKNTDRPGKRSCSVSGRKGKTFGIAMSIPDPPVSSRVLVWPLSSSMLYYSLTGTR